MKHNHPTIKLIDAGILVKKAGFLKTPVKYFANIYYDSISDLHQAIANQEADFSLKKIFMALDEKERLDFFQYLKVISPLHYKISSGKINFSINEKWQSVLIEYDSFFALRKIDDRIGNEKIFNLQDHLKGIYSSSWEPALKKILKWPHTNPPEGLEDFFPKGWQATGLLSSYGYTVGNSGFADEKRKSILSNLVEKKIEQKSFNRSYLNSWGEENTLDRLLKLARTIAVLCRNAKGSPHDFAKAIKEWESDLQFLKNKYFHDFLNLDNRQWPTT